MKTRFFPWRSFWKIYISLISLLIISFVATLAVAFFIFDVKTGDLRLAYLILPFLAISAVTSFIAAYRMTTPLRRVIIKALRLAHKKYDTALQGVHDDDELFEDDSGEYYELEIALDKIRKKMKKRRIQLAHEREESQALMSSLADAVISVDREERVKYFNSSFAAHFLDSAQLKTSSQTSELRLIDVFRDVEILGQIRTALREGNAHTLQKKVSTRLEAAGRYFSIVISPLYEEKSREVYGCMTLFHDFTDFKVSEKMRVEFVENASHELRTPLTSMKGYVATAREDAENGRYEQLPHFLKIISGSVDRLIELVNDLLTISSLESGSVLKLEDVQVEELTTEVVERLSPLAREKNIEIIPVYKVGIFRADFRLLSQVLTNLIANAIKYVQEGGKIEIVWEEVRSENSERQVRLTVRDDGPGIAEEHLGRLFERFYRIDKARSRDAGGTGLGLAIVKHILYSHGGQIQVRSQMGRGSEFICTLPFRT